MENMMSNVAIAGGGLLLVIVNFVVSFVFYVAVLVAALYIARKWHII